MPAASAFSTGRSKPLGSTRHTAIASGLPATAVFIALTIGRLRAGPLIVAAEQRTGVLDAVLARDEERVRRHVIDEDEFPAWMRRERPALRRPRIAGSARQQSRYRPRGHAAHHSAAW